MILVGDALRRTSGPPPISEGDSAVAAAAAAAAVAAGGDDSPGGGVAGAVTSSSSSSSSGLAEGREELMPDPDGANWCMDLAAAKQLFAAAQEQVRARAPAAATRRRRPPPLPPTDEVTARTDRWRGLCTVVGRESRRFHLSASPGSCQPAALYLRRCTKDWRHPVAQWARGYSQHSGVTSRDSSHELVRAMSKSEGAYRSAATGDGSPARSARPATRSRCRCVPNTPQLFAPLVSD